MNSRAMSLHSPSLHENKDAVVVVRLLWRKRRVWVSIVLLAIYSLAIWLDLPPPAGTRYEEDLPTRTIINWGGTPVSGQHAVHWWDKAQALRGWSVYPEGWAWPKLKPAPFARWLSLLGLGVLGAAGLRLLERRAARHPQSVPWLALIMLVLFAYILQLGTLWLKKPNVQQLLLDRITNREFTSYFSSAVEINEIGAFFWKYDSIIRSEVCYGHCKTHPPGPVLFYWLLLHGVYHLPIAWQQGLSDALLAVGNLSPPDLPPAQIVVALLGAHGILLAAAAIVIPLYGLARRLRGPDLALPLAALGTVLPGLILMTPEFDQLYGTLATMLFYLALRGLSPPCRSGWWGLGTGLLFAFCLYWSFGLWVLAIPLVLLIPAAMVGILGTHTPTGKTMTTRLPVHAAVTWLLGLGLGATIPWMLLWGLGGFRLLSVLRAASRAHIQGIIAVRPYVPWVIFNLVTYLQFVGLPLVLATLLTLAWWRGVPSLSMADDSADACYPAVTRNQHESSRFWLNLNLYSVLFWGVLGALDLSGTVRAEVGRLWIFLMPLALMAVYHAAGRGWLTASHIHALLAAQFIVCLLIGGHWLTP